MTNMSQNMMVVLLVFSSVILMTSNHPLVIGGTVLIQSVIFSMLICSTTKSSWPSFMMFIIFLGGLMILFIYVISLEKNIPFYLNMNYMILAPIVMIMGSEKMSIMSKETAGLETVMTEKENMTILFKMYSENSWKMSTIMMIYLFICMITLVNMVNKNKGSLKFKP